MLLFLSHRNYLMCTRFCLVWTLLIWKTDGFAGCMFVCLLVLLLVFHLKEIHDEILGVCSSTRNDATLLYWCILEMCQSDKIPKE